MVEVIRRRITVPTGDILVIKTKRGLLECLSVGDYGKERNIKADFLGLDKWPADFHHAKMMPLTEKWVLTISTQYGCSMGCKFCDVPAVGKGKNATNQDMYDQIESLMDLHPEVRSSKHLNIHFARMGEPTFNPDVVEVATACYEDYRPNFKVHPVVSTMMPRSNNNLEDFLEDWLLLKHYMKGNAGLQLSINSTNENERAEMFDGKAMTLESISSMFKRLTKPKGRKITLNFALADYKINPELLKKYFDPKYFMIKLTPMHITAAAKSNGLYTTFGQYVPIEKDLRDAGYDVIVFLASEVEDDSRITCGNAILSGAMPNNNNYICQETI